MKPGRSTLTVYVCARPPFRGMCEQAKLSDDQPEDELRLQLANLKEILVARTCVLPYCKTVTHTHPTHTYTPGSPRSTQFVTRESLACISPALLLRHRSVHISWRTDAPHAHIASTLRACTRYTLPTLHCKHARARARAHTHTHTHYTDTLHTTAHAYAHTRTGCCIAFPWSLNQSEAV